MTDPTSFQSDAENMVLIRGMPIQERIAWLMHRARSHSTAFQSAESFLARSHYIAHHPAGLIGGNMQSRRIPDDGFLLLPNRPTAKSVLTAPRAELKSGFLSEFAAGIIRAEFPNLKEKMHVRSAVIDWSSRKMELIDCRAA